jgi:hypothetical protein
VACPDLTVSINVRHGSSRQQAPKQLLILTTFNPSGLAAYQFKYIGASKETVSEFNASSRGIGTVNSCTDKEFILKGPNEAGTGTVNFINAAENYEATHDGKSQIVCLRQTK